MSDTRAEVTPSEWALGEMRRQDITHVEPADADEWRDGKGYRWTGFFCLGSGCVEDQTDSHGECINCGEPVVRVWEVEGAQR